MEKTSNAEFQSPARSFYKPFIVDGYDHNFHILDNAVSALESNNVEHQKEYEALKADVALKAYITDVDAKDAIVLADAQAYADSKDAQVLVDAKGYADGAVAALVNGAPETLDTLKELADALGNDADFAASVMAQLAQRVLNTDSRLSDPRNVIDQNGGGALKLWTGTRAEYDAIGAKSNDTLYFIR